MDFLTQQIIGAIHRFRNEVVDLRKSVETFFEQQERHYQEQKVNESLAHPPIRVDAEVREQPAAEREQRTRDNRNLGVQIALALGTWLAFIAAAYYASIAKQQTTLIRQQLVGTQGAIVNIWPSPGIETPPEMTSSGPGSPGFNIAFKNDGHVIARDLRVAINIQRMTLPNRMKIGKSLACEFSLPVLGTDKPKDFQCPLSPLLTEDIWRSMKALEQTISVDGSYSYENGFQERVSEIICLRFVPQVTTKYGQDGDGNFVTCDRFPNTLDRLLKRKAGK